jgi:hypothetical protein
MALRTYFGTAVTAAALWLVATQPAAADPLPGFDLDPVQLEARMDACMGYQVGEQEILLGWVNLRTGKLRHWRCSSLRHMILDVGPGRSAHDPYADVAGFMRCADKVVSDGFPRPATDSRYSDLHYQYVGTKQIAHAVVDDDTGDVATIYTEPVADDWANCAAAL